MGPLSGQLNPASRRRQRRLLALLRRGWLPAVLLLTRASAADQILDRVVAQVDGQVITLSDLRFEGHVALVERGGAGLSDAPLDEAALSSALELAIAQRAAGAEADRLGSFPLEAQDVEARFAHFVGQFPDHAAFEAFLHASGADESQLRDVLGRALRAERALDARVRLRAQVSEGDVRRAWEAAGSPGTFEESRAAIRDRLVRKRYEAAAKEELAKLRAGAQVRIITQPGDLAEAH
jgi:hypothetical protein